MKAIYSFYTKLGLLFLALVVGLGVSVAYLTASALRRFADETEQKLNRELAAQIAVKLQPLLEEAIADSLIEATLEEITKMNPRIEVYLLDPQGNVMGQYLVGEREHAARSRIDLNPVRAFVAGAAPPVLGDDPSLPDSRKPFSAARIEIMGKPDCFVYVILTGAQYEDVTSMVRGSYIVRTGSRSLGLILLATIALGLLLFAQLTRRLRAINSTVALFAQGRMDTRASDEARDEIGQLAKAFNQMADTIEANVAALRKIDSARREMIANISHDLRSPLSSIQGYLETITLKSDALPAVERERYLEIILRNTRSLSSMIEELFELSRLDADQIVPNKESFSIAELLQDLVLQYQPEAEKIGLVIESDLPDRVDLVYGDVALIERVLANLIGNALRFTPAGGRIVVSLSTPDGGAHVRVSDNGPGIPEKDLPHIFDRFYKADEARNKDKGGTGLGLAIARRILHLHDSELLVDSAVGGGTTFHFTLQTVKRSLTAVQPQQNQSSR